MKELKGKKEISRNESVKGCDERELIRVKVYK